MRFTQQSNYKVLDELLAMDHIVAFSKKRILIAGLDSRMLSDDEATVEPLPNDVAPFWRHALIVHGTSLKLIAEYANPTTKVYCQLLMGVIDQIPEDQRLDLMERLPFSTGRYEPELAE